MKTTILKTNYATGERVRHACTITPDPGEGLPMKSEKRFFVEFAPGIGCYMTPDDLVNFEVEGVDLVKMGIYRQKFNHVIPVSYQYTPKPYPQAGDAVRLISPGWRWAGDSIRPDSFGIIGGVVGEPLQNASITWNYCAHRGKGTHGYGEGFDKLGIYVSVSGGPGTISLDPRNLTPTDDYTDVWFWRWSDLPRADSAVYYQLRVKVWEWNGLYKYEAEGRHTVQRSGAKQKGRYWVIRDNAPHHDETRLPKFHTRQDAETVKDYLQSEALHSNYIWDYHLCKWCDAHNIPYKYPCNPLTHFIAK